MISEKKFLEYQLRQEKRFSLMERKLEELKNELSQQELRHKIEMQKILHQKALESLKDHKTDSFPIEEEKEKQKTAGILLEYSEDEETLRKLGFQVKREGVNG